MHILIVCNSVYQVMVAVQLRLHFMQEDCVDIVVSNHLNNGSKIARNIEKIGLFNKVLYVENRKYVVKHGRCLRKLRTIIGRGVETAKNYMISREILHKNRRYDMLFVSNISNFTIILYHKLQKSGCELSVFEDGFSTYCRSFYHSDGASIISRYLVKGGMLGNARRLYLFNPNLLDWGFQGRVVGIPKFSSKNVHLRKILNEIFSYSKDDDYTIHPYLFMEESFFADGYKVNDVELVMSIAHQVGKDKLMVKLHPRNRENRWTRIGIDTNKNMGIPWELILLNQNLTGVTLLTISSSSVLTPFLLLGENVKSISLLSMLKEKPGAMSGELGSFMEKIYNIYPERFLAPRNMTEFFEVL